MPALPGKEIVSNSFSDNLRDLAEGAINPAGGLARREEGLLPPLADLPQSRGEQKLLFTAADSFAEAGRRTLLRQFRKFLAHEEGTRQGKDIEELHDMRVASRRLRAAFRVFGKSLGKQAIAPYREQLEWIAGELGRVRDLDVFIAYLRDYCLTLPASQQRGLRSLLEDREIARQEARAALLKALNSDRYRMFKESFQKFLEDELVHTIARKSGKTVGECAPKDLRKRFRAALAFAPRLCVNPCPETYHQLRIAIKRFRYAAEFFQGLYDGALDFLIGECRQMQDALGEMHDVDVHRDYLTGFAAATRNCSATDEQRMAIEMLLEAERRRYAEQRSKFEHIWINWTQEERREETLNLINSLH